MRNTLLGMVLSRIMLLSTLLLGVEAGLGGCSCISVDLSAYGTANGSKLSFVSGGGSYTLPLTYGDGCNQHDVGTAPTCSGDPGCATWCWVDKANCDQSDVEASTYFPGGPSYSYAACGSVDAFSGFYNLLSTTPPGRHGMPGRLSTTTSSDIMHGGLGTAWIL